MVSDEVKKTFKIKVSGFDMGNSYISQLVGKKSSKYLCVTGFPLQLYLIASFC